MTTGPARFAEIPVHRGAGIPANRAEIFLCNRVGERWVYRELTHGEKDTPLLYNQLNPLYCLNQGSYIHNGS